MHDRLAQWSGFLNALQAAYSISPKSRLLLLADTCHTLQYIAGNEPAAPACWFISSMYCNKMQAAYSISSQFSLLLSVDRGNLLQYMLELNKQLQHFCSALACTAMCGRCPLIAEAWNMDQCYLHCASCSGSHTTEQSICHAYTAWHFALSNLPELLL